MPYQVFCVSALTSEGSEQLNRFLASHRIVSIEKKFLDRDYPQWCFCVEYVARAASEHSTRSKVDYREVLSSDDFAVFAKLRELRKKVAEDNDVPVYAVFTNEQLAQMAQRRVVDKTACFQERGQDKAVARARQFTRVHRWYLKLDVRKYFDTISHRRLMAGLQRKFKDEDLLLLFHRIIESYSKQCGSGLPIGALSSQHFANYYLGSFDQLHEKATPRASLRQVHGRHDCLV